ncbi:hypothetical protein BH23ACT12_BH23ACT12_03220 [soil metagenome]
MKLAFSNIAWDPSEDAQVADLLSRHAIDAIDIAPSKYFPDPPRAGIQEIGAVRRWWEEKGIQITGMQSLLFGVSGLNLFGPPAIQDAMLRHLDAVCRIAAGLGATRLVFGSPRNRDRAGIPDDQVLAIAVPFFRRLGRLAGENGVVICLEPNPPRYGANFMTDSTEASEVVRAVDHPAIRLQLDTGALQINGENPAAVLDAHANIVGHVHASEPDLVPLGDGATDHRVVAGAVRDALPRHVVSIEMVATANEDHLLSMERALRVAILHYSNGN